MDLRPQLLSLSTLSEERPHRTFTLSADVGLEELLKRKAAVEGEEGGPSSPPTQGDGESFALQATDGYGITTESAGGKDAGLISSRRIYHLLSTCHCRLNSASLWLGKGKEGLASVT
ncbi:hypothetical protein MHYP_G00037530 [Metynnis hypsauchen]